MSPLGFEPTISTGERPQTYALDSTATGTGTLCISNYNIAITNNKFGRFQHLISLFRISIGTRKNTLPTYRKFGHAPTKGFASPDAVTELWRNVFQFPEGKWFIDAASIPAVRPTQPPTKWSCFLEGVLTGRCSLDLITHPHLFHVLRMNESISYIPLCAMKACTCIYLAVQFITKSSQKTRSSNDYNLVLGSTNSPIKNVYICVSTRIFLMFCWPCISV